MSGGVVQLSPRGRELLKKQLEFPVFDANSVDGALGQVLASLQQKPPYLLLTEKALPENADIPAVAIVALSTISMRMQATVSAGRRAVLRTFPGITDVGGKLYPVARSEACWRDLLAFARIVGYMCAVGSGDNLSSRGIEVLRQVYDELDVPVDAVLVGVNGMRDQALEDATLLAKDRGVNVEEACSVLNSAFDALLSRLKELQ